jgi:hypothetical protein
VRYREYLVNAHFLTNEAIGNFSIGTTADGVYWINSTHVVYATGSVFHATEKMALTPGGGKKAESDAKITNVEQIMTIECPQLISFLCKYEHITQRTLILQELSREFVFTVKFMERIL